MSHKHQGYRPGSRNDARDDLELDDLQAYAADQEATVLRTGFDLDLDLAPRVGMAAMPREPEHRAPPRTARPSAMQTSTRGPKTPPRTLTPTHHTPTRARSYPQPEVLAYGHVAPTAPPEWLGEEGVDDNGPGLRPLRPVPWEPEYISVKARTATPVRPTRRTTELSDLKHRRDPTEVPAPPWSFGGLLLTLMGWSITATVVAVLVLSWITGALPLP